MEYQRIELKDQNEQHRHSKHRIYRIENGCRVLVGDLSKQRSYCFSGAEIASASMADDPRVEEAWSRSFNPTPDGGVVIQGDGSWSMGEETHYCFGPRYETVRLCRRKVMNPRLGRYILAMSVQSQDYRLITNMTSRESRVEDAPWNQVLFIYWCATVGDVLHTLFDQHIFFLEWPSKSEVPADTSARAKATSPWNLVIGDDRGVMQASYVDLRRRLVVAAAKNDTAFASVVAEAGQRVPPEREAFASEPIAPVKLTTKEQIEMAVAALWAEYPPVGS